MNGPTEQSRMQYGSQYLEQRFPKKEKKVKIKKYALRDLLDRAYRAGHSDAILEMSTIVGELPADETGAEETVDMLMEEV